MNRRRNQKDNDFATIGKIAGTVVTVVVTKIVTKALTSL